MLGIHFYCALENLIDYILFEKIVDLISLIENTKKLRQKNYRHFIFQSIAKSIKLPSVKKGRELFVDISSFSIREKLLT